MRHLVLVVMLAVGSSCWADVDAQHEPGKLVIVSSGNVRYPAAAAHQRLSGKVNVRLRVAPDGAVSKVALVQSSGHKLLDDQALIAAFTWKFNPLPKNSETRDRFAILPITFEEGPLDGDGFGLVLPYVRYPLLSRMLNEKGRLILKVRLSESLRVEEGSMLLSSGFDRLDSAALAAVKDFSFFRKNENERMKSEWRYIEIIFDGEVSSRLLPSAPDV
ncbi:MAG: TonB family protein [Moraxellaceae bacterium]|nr:TonB family protein [Moraxellaceae bacterium]